MSANRIDAPARREEQRPPRARMRLSRRAIRRLFVVAGVYVAGFVILTLLVGGGLDRIGDTLDPAVVVLAFVFETLDSAGGMGFGTALAPLLFVLGFGPLQVVPALLATEATTGLVAGMLHHEFRNIQLSWRPLNAATRTLLLIAGLGAAGAVASATLGYFAVPLPESVIKAYVAVLVLAMGAFTLVHRWLRRPEKYRPRRLVVFAALAGVNKGLGGGGYGPVITLGALVSGIMEKSATAIAALSEGCVAVFGLMAFLAIGAAGVEVDFSLVPSLWLGAFPAAVLAPYAVRVMPNRVLRYAIPVYALGVAVLSIVKLITGAS
jgi:uncharacterized membrane protein YfcA